MVSGGSESEILPLELARVNFLGRGSSACLAFHSSFLIAVCVEHAHSKQICAVSQEDNAMNTGKPHYPAKQCGLIYPLSQSDVALKVSFTVS